MRLLPLLFGGVVLCGVVACVSAPVAPVVAPVASSNAAAPRNVLVIDELSGLGLFRDEAYEADALIAAWARTRGWKVVDPARARAVFDRAHLGQDAKTGAACGLPLSRWRAMHRWATELGAQGRLSANVSCDEKTSACTLSVLASNGVDFDGEPFADLVASFDARAPWREALRHALASLVPAPNDEGKGGLGLLGGLAGDGVQARPERLTFSAWTARAMDHGSDAIKNALSFSSNAPLRACFDGGGNAELTIEVNGDGTIVRCESRDAGDAVTTCACAAFTQHASAATPARGKRVHVGVHFAPADVVTPWGGVVTASTRTYLETYKGRNGDDLWRPDVTDRSIADWKPPSDDRVARCFADVSKPAAARFRARVKLDAVGRATAADLYDPKGFALSDAQRACTIEALLTSRAPCPASATTSALVEVSFSARALTTR